MDGASGSGRFEPSGNSAMFAGYLTRGNGDIRCSICAFRSGGAYSGFACRSRKKPPSRYSG